MEEEDEDMSYEHRVMTERNQTIPNYDEATEIQRLTEAANNSLQHLEQHLKPGKKGRPRKKRTSEGDQGFTADGTKPKRRRGKSATWDGNSAPLLNLPCFSKPLSPMPDLEGLNLPLAYAGTEDIATFVPKVPQRRKSRPTIKTEPQASDPPKYKPGTTMEPMSPLGVPHQMASPPLPQPSMAVPQMTSPRRQVSHESYLNQGLPTQLVPTAPAMSPQISSPQMVSPQMLSPRQPSPQRSPLSSGSMSDTQKKHPLLSTILSVTSPGGSRIPPTASPPGMVSPVAAATRPPRTLASPPGAVSPLSLMAKMQGPTQAPPFAFPPGIKPLETPSTPATPSTADSVFASPTTPIQQEFPQQEDIKPFKNGKGKLPKFDPRLFPMDPVVLAQMRPEDIPMPGQPPKIPTHVQQQMIAQGMQKQVPHQVPQATSAVPAASVSKPAVSQPQIPPAPIGTTVPTPPQISTHSQQMLQAQTALQQQALLHAAQQVRPELLPPSVPQLPIEPRPPQQVPPPQQIPTGTPVTTSAYRPQPGLPVKEHLLEPQVAAVSEAQKVLPTALGVPVIPTQVELPVSAAENIHGLNMNLPESEQRVFTTEVPSPPTELAQAAVSKPTQDVSTEQLESEPKPTSAKAPMSELIKSELLAAAWGSRNPLPPVSLSAKLPDPMSALTPPSMPGDSTESDANPPAYREVTGTTAPQVISAPHTVPYQSVSTPASIPSVPADHQPAAIAGGSQPGLTLPPISTLQSKIPPGMVPGISTLESPPVSDGKEGAEIPAPGQISVPRGALRSPVSSSGFDKDPMLSVPVPVPSTADPQTQPISTQPSPPSMSHADMMRHPLQQLSVAGRLPPPFPLAFAPGLPPVALMMQPPSPLNFPNRPKSPTGPGVPAFSQAPTRASQANHIPSAPALAQQRSPTSEKHKVLTSSLQSPTANTQTQQLEMIMEIMRRELAAGQQQQVQANIKKEGIPNNDQVRPPAPGPTMEMLIAIMQREMAAAQAMQLQAAALQAAHANAQASQTTLQAAQRAQAQAATQVANLQAAQQQIAQAQAKLAQSQLGKAAAKPPQPAAKLPPLVPPPVAGGTTARQEMLSPSNHHQSQQHKSQAAPLSSNATQQPYVPLSSPQTQQQPQVQQAQLQVAYFFKCIQYFFYILKNVVPSFTHSLHQK